MFLGTVLGVPLDLAYSIRNAFYTIKMSLGQL